MQRPAVVSQVGRLLGQQCCPSSQQVALGSGQHAQLKQKLKKLDMQQHVLPAHPTETPNLRFCPDIVTDLRTTLTL